MPNKLKLHLQQCQDCKHKVVDTFEFLTEEDFQKEHPYFSDLNKKNSLGFGIINIAASILIVVSLTIAGLYFSKNNRQSIENKKISALQEDSILIKEQERSQVETNSILKEQNKSETDNKKNKVILPHDQKFIAEADIDDKIYTLSDNQLAMIGHIMRSDYFEAISPKDSTIFKYNEVIYFNWKLDTKEEIIFKIYNYKEELVFETKSNAMNSYRLKEKVDRGAYIWQVETEEDVLHTGVFFIK